MERRTFYAGNAVFPFAVAFIDKSLGTVQKYDLAWLNALYNETSNEVLFVHRDGPLAESELVRRRSEI